MTRRDRTMYQNDGRDRLIPRISLFIYDHARTAAILWLCLTIFGVAAYTTLMRREGFPSVNIPFTVISGTYLVNDPAKVDREVTRPVGDILLADERVKSVQSSARGMFYTVVVQYESGTDVETAGRELEQRIKDEAGLPKQATLKAEAPKFGFTERGDDAVVTVYSSDPAADPKALAAEGRKLTEEIRGRNISDIESVSLIDPFAEATDPRTGRSVMTQSEFDRYGVRQEDGNAFYRSAAVGIMQRDGSDVIKLDDQLQAAVSAYNAEQAGNKGRYTAVVSASYAHDIKDQIGELQRALLEGLVAVLVVGSILIAIRASIITVLSMLTVLAITVAVLFAIGYTLNTITLFALILCLGLIVDDTIIMVEAIDAQRRKHRDPRRTVRIATRKVARAMVAATLTAALSFAPLLFASGVLGTFIRAIPITVIISLLVSLFVALIFIPLFARYLLLRKSQMGKDIGHESHSAASAAGIEERIAGFIGRPMLWAAAGDRPRLRLAFVGMIAVLIGASFVGAGVLLFKEVTFNIFPPSKDTNGLTVGLRFPAGTSIDAAQKTADKAQAIAAEALGENFQTASYYANANEQRANLRINLIPYDEREVKAPELEAKLQSAYQGFEGASVDVGLLDIGPPPSSFTVRIMTDNRMAAFNVAEDIERFLRNVELRRNSGEVARVKEVVLSDPGTYARTGGKSYISVTATFDATDTTTLVALARSAITKEYSDQRLQQLGLSSEVLDFDIGQEQENQDSFKTLALAFPVLLVAIYVLLAVQFRSLLQPLLIFLAIPFSLFGITLGLYLTDNAFSFFAMLGFFALIGLSIKNTILLTDYANQLRREGADAVDAAVGALGERFRPLVATSLTAVVSLIPLAIMSPFWEGLAVVLIGGLLSSTFLVVTVFPYYYLGAEFLRGLVRRTPKATYRLPR